MTITAYIPKGVTRFTKTVNIGSVTLVGGRDFVEAPTVAALKDHIHDLHDIDVSQDGPLTFTAPVSSVPVALYGGAGGAADKDGSSPFGRLRDYFHAIRRFFTHDDFLD